MLKKILFLVCVFSLCILPSSAERFYIDRYGVNIKVYEDKAVGVAERIETVFTKQAHGIYRQITPKGDSFVHLHRVSEDYINQSSGDNLNIKIGKSDVLLPPGKHTYKIGYVYHVMDNKPDFHFNIIGDQWNTNINYVYFKIEMPKAFDSSKIKLTVNKFWFFDVTDGIEYSVSGNIIKGRVLKPLSPRQRVTVKIELPDGYFKHKKINGSTDKDIKHFSDKDLDAPIMQLMLLLAGISFVLWFIFGRDKADNPVVSFYPPENLNSAEVGMLYRGRTDDKDIASLIYYLASKGYIKIINETLPKEKDLYCVINGYGSVFGDFDVSNFRFEKLKEYDGNNKAEEMIMNALFSGQTLNNTFDFIYKMYKQSLEEKGYDREYFIPTNPDIVTQTQLKSSKDFYYSIKNIIEELDKFKKKIFTKTSLNQFLNLFMFLCFETALLSSTWSLFDYTNKFIKSPEILFLGLFLSLGALILFIAAPRGSLVQKITSVIAGSMFILFPIIFTRVYIDVELNFSLVFFTGLISMIIISCCWNNLERWTPEAQNLRNQVLGLRNFLMTADYSSFDSIVAENPNYASDIIPYACNLDIPLENIMQNDNLVMQNLSWYQGDFSHHSFTHFTNNLTYISSPSSSSSSSHSSSGGGHGGGGGGSW